MTIHATVPAVGLDLQSLADGEIPDRPEDICRIARAALTRLIDANGQIASLRMLASQVPGDSTRDAILEWARSNSIRNVAVEELLTEILGLPGVDRTWLATVMVSCRIDRDTIAQKFDLYGIDGDAEMDDDFTFSITREVEVKAPDEDTARQKAEEAAKESVDDDTDYDIDVVDSEVVSSEAA